MTIQTLGQIYDRQCGRKRGHPDQQSAEKEARRMERIEKDRFHAYHCAACGEWHVGHACDAKVWCHRNGYLKAR